MRQEEKQAISRAISLQAIVIEIVEAVANAKKEDRALTLAMQSSVLSQQLQMIYTSSKQLRQDQDTLSLLLISGS